jgi:hypothetical protein
MHHGTAVQQRSFSLVCLVLTISLLLLWYQSPRLARRTVLNTATTTAITTTTTTTTGLFSSGKQAADGTADEVTRKANGAKRAGKHSAADAKQEAAGRVDAVGALCSLLHYWTGVKFVLILHMLEFYLPVVLALILNTHLCVPY